MTKVSAAFGRVRSDDSRALIPIRSRTWCGPMNGVGAPSTWIANVPCFGGAYPWSNELTHSSTRTLAGSGLLPSAM